MSDVLFKIVLASIPLFATIITVLVIPFIKSKISADKLDIVYKWATYAVKCAEMIFNESGKGVEKKQYVMNFLVDKFGKYFTEEQLNILIESAVEELKKLQ